jgi:hypothetical protein
MGYKLSAYRCYTSTAVYKASKTYEARPITY